MPRTITRDEDQTKVLFHYMQCLHTWGYFFTDVIETWLSGKSNSIKVYRFLVLPYVVVFFIGPQKTKQKCSDSELAQTGPFYKLEVVIFKPL